MTEHQLDDADVDAVGEEPAGALVSKIVPAQVDAAQLLAIPGHPFSARLRLVVVGQELQRLPGRLDVGLILPRLGAEHECVGAEGGASLQDGGEATP